MKAPPATRTLLESRALLLGILLFGCVSQIPGPRGASRHPASEAKGTSAPAEPSSTPGATPATAPGAAEPGGPAPLSPALAARVDGILASLSLEEKAAQLVTIGGSGYFLPESAPAFRLLRRMVAEKGVGGVIWFKSHLYETAHLNERLQGLARLPLLFSADLEAHTGMRFEDAIWGASAMAVAATGDPGLAEQRSRATAHEARALGIGQIYAPVADVNVNPDNPIINVRAFGEDVGDVSSFVAATVRGLQSGGVVATLKHFPGHGDTAVDSHRALPILPWDRERLERVELVPFRAGIRAGARSVMVSHLSVPALDATPAPPLDRRTHNEVYTADVTEVEAKGTMPATLSAPIVTGLLREELGFSGLVVTDAMDMGGLAAHFPPGEAAVRTIEAGCDVVLKSADTDAAVRAILDAVRAGRLSQRRLDESVRRVLVEKAWLGLLDDRMPRTAELHRTISSPENLALEEEVARRALTLLREEPGVLPLGNGRRLTSIAVTDETLLPNLGGVLSSELGKRTLESPARSLKLDPRSGEEEVSAALQAAAEADVVILGLFIRPRAGAGKLQIPPQGKRVVDTLLATGKTTIVVSFGSPYLLRDYPAWKTYLCAYGVQDVVQRAVVAALFGEAGISGRLPVTLPDLHPRGSGLQKPASRPTPE